MNWELSSVGLETPRHISGIKYAKSDLLHIGTPYLNLQRTAEQKKIPRTSAKFLDRIDVAPGTLDVDVDTSNQSSMIEAMAIGSSHDLIHHKHTHTLPQFIL